MSSSGDTIEGGSFYKAQRVERSEICGYCRYSTIATMRKLFHLCKDFTENVLRGPIPSQIAFSSAQEHGYNTVKPSFMTQIQRVITL